MCVCVYIFCINIATYSCIDNPVKVVSFRFIAEEDKKWFDICLKTAIHKQVAEDFAEEMNEEPYFIDFLREPREVTGEEDEEESFESPRIYEQVTIELVNSKRAQLHQTKLCRRTFYIIFLNV